MLNIYLRYLIQGRNQINVFRFDFPWIFVYNYCVVYEIYIIYHSIKMAKKNLEKSSWSYEFSALYREKKSRIQELGRSDFIEFLNWVENVNTWKKKEDWKRLIDEWFNKYSNSAIIWLFDMFVKFKNSRWQWYTYEKILNEARSPLRTEIYGENIVRPLFGYYGNYLKYLKKKKIDSDLEKTVKSKPEKADKVRKEKKQEVVETLKAESKESHNDGTIKENKKRLSKKNESIQLEIPFPEDDWNDSESEKKHQDEDPNLDELYKYDPEKENWWNR